MPGAVTFPQTKVRPAAYTRLREHVPVVPPADSRPFPEGRLRVASFVYGGSRYVLARDLAALWNYPSLYHVIKRLVRRSGVSKTALVRGSDAPLNAVLADAGVIQPHEQNTSLFCIHLATLQQIVAEPAALVDLPGRRAHVPRGTKPAVPAPDDDTITLSQVFPNLGAVAASLPPTHATFLALTPLTKLLVYKHEGLYRKVYGTALSAHERELLSQANNYVGDSDRTPGSKAAGDAGRARKPLGRLKKFVGNVDPNQMDVAENVLPGCGYIPEFNVNALCKVPNYFVANKEMGAQQGALFQPPRAHLAGLATKGRKPQDMPKQLYLLLSNTDQEAYHFKYYYFKSYRGPGSGNYKDAALVNRINKIRRFPPDAAPVSNASTHISAGRVTKPRRRRGDLPIKGLTHDYFSHENVEIVVERQRRFAEDFENLEMLHNNALFNLLVNGYRDVARDTWDAFYQFKMIDFEKIHLRKQKDARAAARAADPMAFPPLARDVLTARFLLPSDYAEIMEKLPCELRGEDEDPAHALSEPVRYVARYPDKNVPEMLNQIEVIKLPNANSIAWDNIRKYKRA
ncbi:hypothetical protein METBIDRAFT_10942 [Metschnikowia bicuspidata var. bicuspidata NRRL YB-4993]|uniref:Uncharacterized protein n=1 Tax=Metschnikowia bicuspidata var. bicuspidata NRRL YB-4993 TaxID=869754 RepID=A0A1A0HD88_9ASCO|nr:hypothetical protein METBIDRAFT_10942 [Metschnikowia bicuspidata var. bicuspidata NRRL YB-4993]OBA22044.1 hypothetical protein METBIDRAFT_10942 [Metschnikowia bicuspidata var. bicuspidata NRRL YB-4993]